MKGGTNRAIRFAGVRAQLSHAKVRRSPLRLNVSGRERQRRVEFKNTKIVFS